MLFCKEEVAGWRSDEIYNTVPNATSTIDFLVVVFLYLLLVFVFVFLKTGNITPLNVSVKEHFFHFLLLRRSDLHFFTFTFVLLFFDFLSCCITDHHCLFSPILDLNWYFKCLWLFNSFIGIRTSNKILEKIEKSTNYFLFLLFSNFSSFKHCIFTKWGKCDVPESFL